jgi:hypothetical protein
MPLFKELAGSPVETYGPDGMQAERRLLCAYEDRQAVVAALLGNADILGGLGRAEYPGCPGVLAMRVRVEPFEKRPDEQGPFNDLTADLNSYSGQFVELVVNYEMLDADAHRPDLPMPEPGTVLTYRMTFAGEYLRLPSHGLAWQSAATLPVAPDAVPTLRLPIVEHHVTWHRVVQPPWEAIRECVGAVNNDLFLGAAAETLLCDGAKADRELAGFDDLHAPQCAWRIIYVFREKAIKVLDATAGPVVYGWNHAYHALLASPGWDRLVDADGNCLYRTADFATLFSFGAV